MTPELFADAPGPANNFDDIATRRRMYLYIPIALQICLADAKSYLFVQQRLAAICLFSCPLEASSYQTEGYLFFFKGSSVFIPSVGWCSFASLYNGVYTHVRVAHKLICPVHAERRTTRDYLSA